MSDPPTQELGTQELGSENLARYATDRWATHDVITQCGMHVDGTHQ